VVRTHLVFVVTLAVVGPVLAIAAVATGGRWAPAGVAAAAGLVAASAFASFLSLRRQPQGASALRMRMMGVTASVSVAAGILAIGCTIWLVVEAISG
jgi:hypothetical protein